MLINGLCAVVYLGRKNICEGTGATKASKASIGFDLEHVEEAVGCKRRFKVCFSVSCESDRLCMKASAPQERTVFLRG